MALNMYLFVLKVILLELFVTKYSIGQDPVLIVNTEKEIRSVPIEKDFNATDFESMDLLYSTPNKVLSVDYNFRGNYIVWSEEKSIHVAPLEEEERNTLFIEQEKVLIAKDIHHSRGVTIDWVHDLLFWTDRNQNTISAANIKNPNMRYVIISDAGLRPNVVCVNPIEGFIVWSNDDSIQKANEDGTERVAIVNTDYGESFAISIDYKRKLIYWADLVLEQLSSMDYYGNFRKVLLESPAVNTPAGLDLYGDEMFWSEYFDKKFVKTLKHGRDSNIDIIVNTKSKPRSVRIIHPSQQPNATNRCAKSPCTHLCIPTGLTGYRCVCPEDKYLENFSACNDHGHLHLLKVSDGIKAQINANANGSTTISIIRNTKRIPKTTFNISNILEKNRNVSEAFINKDTYTFWTVLTFILIAALLIWNFAIFRYIKRHRGYWSNSYQHNITYSVPTNSRIRDDFFHRWFRPLLKLRS